MTRRWDDTENEASYIVTGTKAQLEELEREGGIKLADISQYRIVQRITAKRMLKNIKHAWAEFD